MITLVCHVSAPTPSGMEGASFLLCTTCLQNACYERGLELGESF